MTIQGSSLEDDRKNAREALGREAYDIYGKQVGGLNYQGLPMPRWEHLTEKIHNAWIETGVGMYFLGAEMERTIQRATLLGIFSTLDKHLKIDGHFVDDQSTYENTRS